MIRELASEMTVEPKMLPPTTVMETESTANGACVHYGRTSIMLLEIPQAGELSMATNRTSIHKPTAKRAHPKS